MEAQEDRANGVFKKNKGFTVIYNTAARDRRLSEKALGLYTRIASYITMPNETITKAKILSWCSCGSKAFERAWQELKACGYLIQRMQAGSGRDWKVEYELLATPREDGIHTFYLNAAGEITKTNLTRQKKQTEETIHKKSTEKIVENDTRSKIQENDVTPKIGITSESPKNDVTPKTGITSESPETSTFRRYPHFGYNHNGDNDKGGNKIKTINIKTNINNINSSSHPPIKTTINSSSHPPAKNEKKNSESSFCCEETKNEKSLLEEWKETRPLEEPMYSILQAVSQELQGRDKINLGTYAAPFWASAHSVKEQILSLSEEQMNEYRKQFQAYNQPIRNPGRFHLIGLYNQTRAAGLSRFKREERGRPTSWNAACQQRKYENQDWQRMEHLLNQC